MLGEQEAQVLTRVAGHTTNTGWEYVHFPCVCKKQKVYIKNRATAESTLDGTANLQREAPGMQSPQLAPEARELLPFPWLQNELIIASPGLAGASGVAMVTFSTAA